MVLPTTKRPVVLTTDMNKREPSTPSLTWKESERPTDKYSTVPVIQTTIFDVTGRAARTMVPSRRGDRWSAIAMSSILPHVHSLAHYVKMPIPESHIWPTTSWRPTVYGFKFNEYGFGIWDMGFGALRSMLEIEPKFTWAGAIIGVVYGNGVAIGLELLLPAEAWDVWMFGYIGSWDICDT